MIHTSEIITDPEVFLTDQPGVVNHVQDEGHQMITSPSLDILVKPSNNRTKVGRTEEETSSILGNLYLQGQLYSLRVNDELYDVTWFPSAEYVDRLMETLGMRPGEDALKFTLLPEDDKIPKDTYTKHFANLEYPLSTGPDRFAHDRGDHAIGAIIMPSSVTRKIVPAIATAAEQQVAYDNRSRLSFSRLLGVSESPADKLTRNLDRITADVNEVGDYLHTGAPKYDHTEQPLHYPHFSVSYRPYTESLAGIWGMDKETAKSYDKFADFVSKLIGDRLLDLMPAIEAAQKSGVLVNSDQMLSEN